MIKTDVSKQGQCHPEALLDGNVGGDGTGKRLVLSEMLNVKVMEVGVQWGGNVMCHG